MKKAILVAFLVSFFSIGAVASSGEEELKGFFTTKWCAENKVFRNCPEETLVCGYPGCYEKWNPGEVKETELALFVHSTGKVYNVKLGNLPKAEVLDAIIRNDVTLKGKVDADTIVADEMKAPPPPGKSFFKGCL